MSMTRLIKALATTLVLASPALAETPRTIIVMDGSGSMWGQIDGRAKLEIARDTVATVLGTIPAEQELGLLAYGHREKGNCSDIELIVPPAPGTGAEIAAEVAKMRFLGKTPLSESVRQAAEALRYGEEAATVVLVTDGLETCDADPCALGRELEAAGLNFTAHVIGFGLTKEEGAEVACLATETGGQYLEAGNASTLADALTTAVAAPPPTPTTPGVMLFSERDFTGDSFFLEADTPDFTQVFLPDGTSLNDWAASARVVGDWEICEHIHYEGQCHPIAGDLPDLGAFDRSASSLRRPAASGAAASITAPDSAPGGSIVRVTFEVPRKGSDYIRVLDADGNLRTEVGVGEDPFVDIRMPFEPGPHYLVYLSNLHTEIGRRPITITEAPVSITAPDSAPAGSVIDVAWTGPGAWYDYIQLVDADGKRLSEVAIGSGTSPVSLHLPWATGDFALVYKFETNDVIFSRPITLTETPISINAPDSVQVGTSLTITWVGPNAIYDNIQLVNVDTDEGHGYGYTQGNDSMDWTMPDTPGNYEFRYKFWDSEVIYTRPITLTLDKVEAAPAPGPASGLVIVPVSLSVPTEYAGQPINWSAEPLDPHPEAPEALAMVEALQAPWSFDLYPGRWRIYGEAPVGVTGGQGFGADITVTDAAGQAFEIPLTPMETMGMGEDPVATGPVPIWIKPQYDAIFTRWQATPASGQNSEMLGTDYQPKGWQTALDPGRWLIEGFAEGGEGHLYAAVLDITPDSLPEITLARTVGMSQAPLTLPNGEMAKAHCLGDVGCYHSDQAGHLRYMLLPGWAASAALNYETAGGAAASVPSVDFYNGTPLQVMAALNPRQWDAMLGPCADTALGPLCSATEADPAAIALLGASLAALSDAPETAQAPAPETEEPRLQTDGTAMQIDTPIDLPKGFDPIELLAPQLMSKE